MNLFFRSAQVLSQAAFEPDISSFDAEVSYAFRVLPFDIDVFRHMNNARYLNYMEATRWGLAKRSGLLKLCIKNGWTLPIGEIDIRFLRPILLWQKITVSAQVVAQRQKWFYIYQEFRIASRIACQALVAATVHDGKARVSPETYLAGKPPVAAAANPAIQDWIEALESRQRGPLAGSSPAVRT